MVESLGPQAFTAEGPGSIPGSETKIPLVTLHSQNFFKQIIKKNRQQINMVQMDETRGPRASEMSQSQKEIGSLKR